MCVIFCSRWVTKYSVQLRLQQYLREQTCNFVFDFAELFAKMVVRNPGKLLWFFDSVKTWNDMFLIEKKSFVRMIRIIFPVGSYCKSVVLIQSIQQESNRRHFVRSYRSAIFWLFKSLNCALLRNKYYSLLAYCVIVVITFSKIPEAIRGNVSRKSSQRTKINEQSSSKVYAQVWVIRQEVETIIGNWECGWLAGKMAL